MKRANVRVFSKDIFTPVYTSEVELKGDLSEYMTVSQANSSEKSHLDNR